MKTYTSKTTPKLIHQLRLWQAFIVLTILVAPMLGTRSARAGDIYNLTLTENSGTSLTLAYNGTPNAFSVLNTGADSWTISVLSESISLADFEYNFAEPENPLATNDVFHNSDFSRDMFVQSDVVITSQNRTPSGPNANFIGFDGQVLIFLSFIDNAASSEAPSGVPETGSTFGLLVLSLAALAGVGRVRALRPA